jgi:hypothetical protein
MDIQNKHVHTNKDNLDNHGDREESVHKYTYTSIYAITYIKSTKL